MTSSSSTPKPVRVGIIGAGGVSQVIHLPTLTLLSDLYKVTAICDISAQAVAHCQKKFNIAHGFSDAAELVKQDDVDLVVVASADEYHCDHVIQAADAKKNVLVEKPMTLTRAEAERIEEARVRNKVHIVVAYMRRYTPVFAVFLHEVQKAGRINFARVFDYPGGNPKFIAQSATWPKAFPEDITQAAKDELAQRAQALAREALGERKAKDERAVKGYRLLNNLAAHDISAMRHALGGVPDRCTTAFVSPSGEFVGATFIYDKQPLGNGPDDKRDHPFQVSFEAGFHTVQTFPAYIEVFGENAIVSLKYDTPFVKGLPIYVNVRENSKIKGQGYEDRQIRPTYEDAYSAEFIRLHANLQQPFQPEASAQALDRQNWGESSEMCGPGDAIKDLDVFDMVMAHIAPDA